MAIASVVLASCGEGSPEPSRVTRPATIPAPASLATTGELVNCLAIGYPPLEYYPSTDVTDPDGAIGFDVDAARETAATMGLRMTIRDIPFAALIPDLAAERCDIVWSGLFISDERLQVADAVPYMRTGHGVLVEAGNPAGLHGLDDMCGATIGITNGGFVQVVAGEASEACTDGGRPAIDIQGYERFVDAFQQLLLGRVDGVWDDRAGLATWMTAHPDQYEIAFMVSEDQVYGVYYAKGRSDVGDALTAALRELEGDGTLAALAEQYGLDPATLDVID